MAETWLVCSSCRTPIAFGAKHWVCSVSTCNRNRTRLVFCSVACWDAHLGEARHRDAGAIEARAPSKEAWQREQAELGPEAGPGDVRRASPALINTHAPTQRIQVSAMTATAAAAVTSASGSGPVRRVVGDSSASTAAALEGTELSETFDKDILIVVSKLKKYIKDRSGMNCSDVVAEVLSDHVRQICDESIRAAGRDERKTVLERDVPRPRR